jgi:hypothetical protein
VPTFVERLRRKPRVRPRNDPPWQVRKQGRSRIYEGFFLVRDRAGRLVLRAPGRVVERPGFAADVYIQNPPAAIRTHPHGSCFQLVDPHSMWFKLHWERPARDLTASVALVELILAESVLDVHGRARTSRAA